MSHPEKAAEWRDAGFHPNELTDWAKHGIKPEAAVRWRASGIAAGWFLAREPETAAAWQAAGCSPQEWERWSPFLDDPEIVRRLVDEGFDRPSEIADWLALGVTAANDLRLVHATNLTPEDYRRFQELGAGDPASIVAWAEKWPLKDASRWCQSTGSNLTTAWEWHAVCRGDLGIAQTWQRAQVTDPTLARTWTDSGFSAAEAEAWIAAGAKTPRVAAAAATTGCSAQEAVGWIELGAADLDRALWWSAAWHLDVAREWCSKTGEELSPAWELSQLTGSIRELERWRQLGFVSLEATRLAHELVGSDCDHSPLEMMQALHRAGVALPEVGLAWLASGMSPTNVLNWASVGIRNLNEATAWSSAGFEPVSAGRWRSVSPDAATAAHWRRATHDDISLVRRWKKAGVTDAADVTRLDLAGLTIDGATAWRKHGIEGADALLVWHQRWELEAARTWCLALGLDVPNAHAWRETTNGDLELTHRWRAIGVRVPERAGHWASAGFDPDRAAPWLDVDLHDPDLAARWAQLQFSPKEARTWITAGHASEVACRWRSASFTAKPAIAWIAAGSSDPDEALMLQRIGFTAQRFKTATDGVSAMQRSTVIREQAFRHAGLGVADGLPALTVDDAASDVVARAARYSAALSRAGEGELMVVHGSPHLTLSAIYALPDARYVRGGAKAAIWHAIQDRIIPSVGPTKIAGECLPHRLVESGRATVLALEGVAEERTVLLMPNDSDSNDDVRAETKRVAVGLGRP